jgi:ferritin-like metal-binding protein YciE
MELESLRELYVDELKDLYSAENQILKALPKMIKAATSKELKAGFQKHLEQTKEHVTRLEKFSRSSGPPPKEKSARAWKA